jgi:cyclopropane fatty-acyl-phospholipid synthase-like methyltransferase
LPERVELYDTAYGKYLSDTYRQVRVATYGEDLGQTSWVTQEESAAIPQLLKLTRDSTVLEIGCGSGAYAVHLAEKVGCEIVGVDINAAGIETANKLAEARRLHTRAKFQQCDVATKLPFTTGTFEAVFANDVLCHIKERASLLEEMHRVLRRDGLMLFSDALVIGGMISHEEIAIRSSIGFYVFSPPGENERLMQLAGFRLLTASDTTDAAAAVARRWHDAREKHRDELIKAEGAQTYGGLQRFLHCVTTLTQERRLLRFLYCAQRGS